VDGSKVVCVGGSGGSVFCRCGFVWWVLILIWVRGLSFWVGGGFCWDSGGEGLVVEGVEGGCVVGMCGFPGFLNGAIGRWRARVMLCRVVVVGGVWGVCRWGVFGIDGGMGG